MAMNQKLDKIAEKIKSIAEQQLAPANVAEIKLYGDFDHDGDPILRVEVVFDAEEDRLDPLKVKGLIRHLREPLDEFAEVGFPVLKFITSEENTSEAA